MYTLHYLSLYSVRVHTVLDSVSVTPQIKDVHRHKTPYRLSGVINSCVGLGVQCVVKVIQKSYTG